ncbi:FAD-dependent monooxygenase [Amycolatopsis anabasis]|uniref:FAD-dependent monooxygenase n=1 Tax=Amycolatopsis anabasis TaxID=1840409 RepID=UPI00131E6187|nr:FAD-dependent monooxygenase [Amycolatopsis anabasis]
MDYEVAICGGGPVGLMLACELGLAGVDVVVLERLTEIDQTIKAGAINLPTGEAFYRRGMLGALQEEQRLGIERMLEFRRSRGADVVAAPRKKPMFAGHFAGIMVGGDLVDYDDPDFRDVGPVAGVMAVGQQAIEAILAERAAELGVTVRRGVEVTGFDADDDGVTVHFGESSLRAGWLVGCDGGRSQVRKLTGFDFPGTDPSITAYQAIVDLEGAEELRPGWNRTENGIYVHGPIPGRILSVEFDSPPADREAPITAAELQASLRKTSGVEVTVTAVRSATRATDNARQATTYRRGRVLLAGDAAHVHSPFGGQGLNLGIGDAVNLGWKLAATIQGRAPEGLLDTYTTERHPIGAWVLEWTRAQVALMRSDPRAHALHGVVTDLLRTRDGATYLAKKLSGVLHRYDLGDGHPMVGFSAPDLEFADGTRLGGHCADGKPLLLDLADSAELRAVAANWDVRVLTTKSVSRPELTGLLLRPDGHVAWASEESTVEGLIEAVSRFAIPV